MMHSVFPLAFPFGEGHQPNETRIVCSNEKACHCEPSRRMVWQSVSLYAEICSISNLLPAKRDGFPHQCCDTGSE